MIYIGSDHGGFKLKEELKAFLERENIAFEDVGPNKFDSADDYPVFASKASKPVSKDPQKNKAILLCRSGHGVCIAANKFKKCPRSAMLG
jgi:ribose 5-phosphate isomerase B